MTLALTDNGDFGNAYLRTIVTAAPILSVMVFSLIGGYQTFQDRLPAPTPLTRRMFQILCYTGASLAGAFSLLITTVVFGDQFVAQTYAGDGAGDNAFPTSVAFKHGYWGLWLRYIFCAFLMLASAAFSFFFTGVKVGWNYWNTEREFWIGRLVFLIGVVVVLACAWAAYHSGVAILKAAGVPRL